MGKIPAELKDAFSYDPKGLEQAWSDLHRGDHEPFPSEETVTRITQSSDAAELSTMLIDAWSAYHSGDFARAIELGETHLPLGGVVASKARGIHAAHVLEDSDAKRDAFETAAHRADESAEALPMHANCHYQRAFNWGRFGQEISIVKALRRGIGKKVREALDQVLELDPDHGEAHLALAMYHAEIVDKIGGVAAKMTYGATRKAAEAHFTKALELIPEFPITHIEYGNGLLLLYGDERYDEASEHYVKASEMKPRDAMEWFDVRYAASYLE